MWLGHHVVRLRPQLKTKPCAERCGAEEGWKVEGACRVCRPHRTHVLHVGNLHMSLRIPYTRG